MPPKKPVAGATSPLKKKLKDPSKALGGDGADKDHARADGGASGAGQDNDEMDAYHEPVRLMYLIWVYCMRICVSKHCSDYLCR